MPLTPNKPMLVEAFVPVRNDGDEAVWRSYALDGSAVTVRRSKKTSPVSGWHYVWTIYVQGHGAAATLQNQEPDVERATGSHIIVVT
jgi:hypothetical protein